VPAGGAPWMRTAALGRVGMSVVVALGCAACAGGAAGNRFIQKSGSGPVELLERPWPKTVGQSADDAVRKATAAARATRPAPAAALTIESSPGELRAALASLDAQPTPAAHVRVGLAYRRAGVLDQALEHFDAALKQNPRMAAAYDGRARIWREWGLPGLGLGDASRAVFFAPSSASARNTLGTLLAALADCEGARSAYARALTLDSSAAYARGNLQRLEAGMATATERCRAPSPVNGPPRPIAEKTGQLR
jgi:tetratricopeptide (TPR) repeat protein